MNALVLCRGKASYGTMALARAMRDKRQPFERARLYAYQCQDQRCGLFHITKKRPPPEAMRPQAGALSPLAKGGVR